MYRISTRDIQGIRYCPIRKLLEVQFKGEDMVYQYFDVPEEVWYNMRNTASVDMYFNTMVATNYRVKCVNKQKKC